MLRDWLLLVCFRQRLTPFLNFLAGWLFFHSTVTRTSINIDSMSHPRDLPPDFWTGGEEIRTSTSRSAGSSTERLLVPATGPHPQMVQPNFIQRQMAAPHQDYYHYDQYYQLPNFGGYPPRPEPHGVFTEQIPFEPSRAYPSFQRLQQQPQPRLSPLEHGYPHEISQFRADYGSGHQLPLQRTSPAHPTATMPPPPQMRQIQETTPKVKEENIPKKPKPKPMAPATSPFVCPIPSCGLSYRCDPRFRAFSMI